MNTRTFYRATIKFIAALMIVMLALVGTAFADTAANHAGTGTNVGGPGSEDWSNPGNITADDTSYATVGLSSWFGSTSEYLQGTNYGFNIPAGATIDGIQVSIMRQSDSSSGDNINDAVVRLIKNGTIVGDNKATSSNWNNNWVAATYGGPIDLWGETWTDADINDPDFGVALSVINDETWRTRTARVDYMQITVTYTVPLPPTTTTLSIFVEPLECRRFRDLHGHSDPRRCDRYGHLPGWRDLARHRHACRWCGQPQHERASSWSAQHHGCVQWRCQLFRQHIRGACAGSQPGADHHHSSAATTFAVGSPGNFTVTVSGYPASTITLTPNTLPGGVNFNTGTGVFSGTPELRHSWRL